MQRRVFKEYAIPLCTKMLELPKYMQLIHFCGEHSLTAPCDNLLSPNGSRSLIATVTNWRVYNERTTADSNIGDGRKETHFLKLFGKKIDFFSVLIFVSS